MKVTVYTTENPNETVTVTVDMLPRSLDESGVVLAESVTIIPSSITLLVGESGSLNARVSPENTTDKTISWSSSDELIASVDINGTVTAVGVGKCIITGSCGEVSSFCSVNVEPILPSVISLSQKYVELQKGQSQTVSASILPHNATDKTIVWTSSDPNVAIVSDGRITGVNQGVTTITAHTVNNLEDYCTVKVLPILPEAISISEVSAELFPEQSIQLKVTFYPNNTTATFINWYSSDDNIAEVDNNGMVKAISVGSCIVTAETINGLKAICAIKVNPILPENISLDKQELKLTIGDSTYLNATILPTNTTDKSISWASDDQN